MNRSPGGSNSGLLGVKRRPRRNSGIMHTHVKASRSARWRDNQLVDTRPLIMISGIYCDTRYMLRVLLEMWGYRVMEAEGSNETLKYVRTRGLRMVILDTSLAFEDDLQVLREIRHSDIGGSVPVLVLTGFPQIRHRKAAFENGATGLLVKPMDLDLLEGYLEDFIGE